VLNHLSHTPSNFALHFISNGISFFIGLALNHNSAASAYRYLGKQAYASTSRKYVVLTQLSEQVMPTSLFRKIKAS
jgi:hypothetical protein